MATDEHNREAERILAEACARPLDTLRLLIDSDDRQVAKWARAELRQRYNRMIEAMGGRPER